MNPAKLSFRQGAVLLVLFILGLVFSYQWWVANPNRFVVLVDHPEWEFDYHVIYDGYGNYSEHLHRVLVSPGRESLSELADFTDGYIHAIRPLFPLLIAIANILFDDILLSALVVNLATVLFCWWAFHLLAQRVANGDGDALFHLHLLFIGHIAVIGMLARPMADPLSIGLLLICMELFMRVIEHRRPVDIVLLALAGILMLLAKTVFILALVAFPLALLSTKPQFWRENWIRVILTALGVLTVGAGVILAVRVLPATEATWQFIQAFFAGLRHFPLWGSELVAFLTAAVLFLALALQIHPLFAWRNPRALELLGRLQLWWILAYAAQRFLFYGFSLGHSRARYGLPLVAAALILSYPGLRRTLGEKWTPRVVWGIVVLNFLVFGVTLLRAM